MPLREKILHPFRSSDKHSNSESDAAINGSTTTMCSESLPQTMKAIQLTGYKEKYQLNEVPLPKVGDNDLLLKSGAAGFCHTDYQVWEGVYDSPTPLSPSHEPVGTVVAMGAKAAKSGKWKMGDRVGVLLFKHQCHDCLGCETYKDIRFCHNKDLAGLQNDGGMAEYGTADADNSVLLPDSVPFVQAAPLMCAGTTTWVGVDHLSGLPPNSPIAVVGIGGLGGLGIQFAKAKGFRVAAVDIRPEGRALASEVPVKPDLIVDPNEDGIDDKLKAWSDNLGFAGVVICTDYNDATMWAINHLRPRGVAVEIGLPTKPLSFDAFKVVFDEIQIRGSLVSNKEQAEAMMKVVAEHGISTYINAVTIEEAVDLPDMYMDPHLKGRLVVRF